MDLPDVPYRVEVDNDILNTVVARLRNSELDEVIKTQILRAMKYDLGDLDEQRLFNVFPKTEYTADLFEGSDEDSKEFRALVANTSRIKPFIMGTFVLSKYRVTNSEKIAYAMTAYTTGAVLERFTINISIDWKYLTRLRTLRGWSKDMAEFNTGRKWEHTCPRCGKRCNFREVLFGVLCRDCYRERC